MDHVKYAGGKILIISSYNLYWDLLYYNNINSGNIKSHP